MDLADDGLGKLTLLALLNLTLVAHPRVKNLLGLRSKGSALLELVSLSLKLSGFLLHSQQLNSTTYSIPSLCYLGDRKELLGNVNNTGELVDVVHTLLNSAGVVVTGSVQDVLVLLNLALSPLAVSGTTILANGSENAEKTEGGNGFLVQDVELVADGGDGDTGSGGKDGSLGNQGVARKRVEDRLSLLLGVLRDVGGRAGGRNVGSDGEVARGQGRPQAGST